MKKYSNIYYFNTICKIGGIETFFYQLAKRYKDLDLTIIYSHADPIQLKRLRKYVRCRKFTGEKIKCDKAFFNFNTDIIDDVEAKEYCLVLHGDYKALGVLPPMHKKITKYYGCSQLACDSFKELTGNEAELTYNPIEKESFKPLIKLCTASRLDDPCKGSNRLRELIKKLDEYSNEHEVNYMFTIFTDTTKYVDSPNVCYMKPRLDIMPYIADSNFVVQLSDCEGYNYTINEALLNKVPVVITPCGVFDELGIDDTMSIRLDFDLSNIDEVVEKIFTSKFKVNYEPPKDNWDKILTKKKSTYKEDEDEEIEVKVIKEYNDIELGRWVERGEILKLPISRAEYLMDHNVIVKREANIQKTSNM